MALQPRPSLPCLGEGAQGSLYVYSIPSDVLGKFCEQMDCLNEYDWLRFASNVITDQTELRKIKYMEKTGISITRELMWWWTIRLGTVQQLLELLNELQFYRAAKIIADWSLHLPTDSAKTHSDLTQQENASLHPHGNRLGGIRNGAEISIPSNSAHPDPVLQEDPNCPPLTPPPASIDLPHSLQSNPPASSSMKFTERNGKLLLHCFARILRRLTVLRPSCDSFVVEPQPDEPRGELTSYSKDQFSFLENCRPQLKVGNPSSFALSCCVRQPSRFFLQPDLSTRNKLDRRKVVKCSKPHSSSIPQQESLHNLPSRNLVWTKAEVETVTNGFSEENRINESIFADTFKGPRHNVLYAVKRLKEKECANPNQTQRFFRTEVQICFRCCHHNILHLLGFTVESGFHCLIYPYMPNGSLTDRLQCQGGSEPLTWEKRIRISIALVQTIQYLHNFDILHGNVKSSNVLLDANFVPKLGHAGCRLQPVAKTTENGGMETKVMQVSLAYFPEDFIRHGQLTEKVDIFSCGIVLAEILTGIKAMDERRHPIFLKNALLDEIQVAKKLSCSQKGTFENIAAKAICGKYQDKNVLHWPATPTIYLATAACMCLRKKNPQMAEVNAIMEKLDHQMQYQKMSEGRKYPELSLNTPEETNDEPASPFNNGSSDDNCDGSINAESLNCVDLLPPLMSVKSPETYPEQMLRVPCESDESSNFPWDPLEDVAYQAPVGGLPENIFPIMCLANNPEYNDITAKSIDSERHIPQEVAVSSNRTLLNIENSGATCSSEVSAKETVTEIKINDQKKKMMQDILLYEDKKLNTSELLNIN